MLRVDVDRVAIAGLRELLHQRVVEVARAHAEDRQVDAGLALSRDEALQLALIADADVEVAVGGEDHAVHRLRVVLPVRAVGPLLERGTGGKGLTHGYVFASATFANPSTYRATMSASMFTSVPGFSRDSVVTGTHFTDNGGWGVLHTKGVGDDFATNDAGSITPLPGDNTFSGNGLGPFLEN